LTIREEQMPDTFSNGGAVEFIKRQRPGPLATLIGFQLFCATAALAQTVPPEGPAPGGPASPAGTTGGGWAWLWILLVIVVIAAAIWYGTRRRRG
jgi:hypothetical protein